MGGIEQMSVFGWSYPPGCSGPPEDDRDCEGCPVCYQPEDKCVCRVCPGCECVGDPSCYREEAIQTRPSAGKPRQHHNQTMSGEQWRLRFKTEKQLAQIAASEAEFYEKRFGSDADEWGLFGEVFPEPEPLP
jgi:hypothetical protein